MRSATTGASLGCLLIVLGALLPFAGANRDKKWEHYDEDGVYDRGMGPGSEMDPDVIAQYGREDYYDHLKYPDENQPREELPEEYPTLSSCNGCVAFATEVCRHVMDHLGTKSEAHEEVKEIQRQRIEKQHAEGEGHDPDQHHHQKSDSNHVEVSSAATEQYDREFPAIKSVIDRAVGQACDENVVKNYKFVPDAPASEISETCRRFHVHNHEDVLEDFWRTFLRKEVSCAYAVDLLCAHHTDVCKSYEPEAKVLHGMATTVYNKHFVPDQREDRSDEL